MPATEPAFLFLALLGSRPILRKGLAAANGGDGQGYWLGDTAQESAEPTAAGDSNGC